MKLSQLGLVGVILACCGVSSGLTIIAVGQLPIGLGVLLGGGVVGLLLIVLGRQKAPTRGTSATRGAAPPPPAAEPAGTASSKIPESVKAQFTPGGGTGSGAHQVAGASDMTVAQEFVADDQAHAPVGLADIYQEMRKKDVHGYLLVVAGPDRGRSMPVKDSPISIGRGEHNSFQLSDATVSTTQASVAFADGKLVVSDFGSKNGTFVNNNRITEQPLENCDVMAFGATKILVTAG